MSELKKLAPGKSLGFKSALNMVMVCFIVCTSAIIISAAAFRSALEQDLMDDAKNVAYSVAAVLQDENAHYNASRKLREIQGYYAVEGLVVFLPQGDQVLCYYNYIRGRSEMVYGEGKLLSYEKAGLKESKPLVSQGEIPESFLLSRCACGVEPLAAPDGSAAAYALVGLSTEHVAEQVRDFVVRLIRMEVLLCVILGVLSALVAHWLIVKPIDELAELTRDFVQRQRSGALMDGFVMTKARQNRGDEIGRLREYIRQMEKDIYTYIHELTKITAEKERISAELNVATQIQASMLPSIFPPFPDRSEFDLAASMDPAKEVGGDFYDFFLVDDDHLALVMADVSGKGVPAALFMVITKTLLKNAAQQGMSPKEVLDLVNAQLCEGNDADMFVTVWLGILEISTGILTCANAGHEYPALRHPDGTYALYHDQHGFVLAGSSRSRYTQYTLNLKPGDCIFVYTDGVPEATNANKELFGTDRMLEALNAASAAAAAPNEFLPLVRRTIDSFVGSVPQFDDITMLAMRYKGPQNEQGG